MSLLDELCADVTAPAAAAGTNIPLISEAGGSHEQATVHTALVQTRPRMQVTYSGSQLSNLADHINRRTSNSKYIQRECQKLFLYHYLWSETKRAAAGHTASVEYAAVVVDVSPVSCFSSPVGVATVSQRNHPSVSLFIPKFDMQTRVYIDASIGIATATATATATANAATMGASCARERPQVTNHIHETIDSSILADLATEPMTQYSCRVVEGPGTSTKARLLAIYKAGSDTDQKPSTDEYAHLAGLSVVAQRSAGMVVLKPTQRVLVRLSVTGSVFRMRLGVKIQHILDGTERPAADATAAPGAVSTGVDTVPPAVANHTTQSVGGDSMPPATVAKDTIPRSASVHPMTLSLFATRKRKMAGGLTPCGCCNGGSTSSCVGREGIIFPTTAASAVVRVQVKGTTRAAFGVIPGRNIPEMSGGSSAKRATEPQLPPIPAIYMTYPHTITSDATNAGRNASQHGSVNSSARFQTTSQQPSQQLIGHSQPIDVLDEWPEEENLPGVSPAAYDDSSDSSGTGGGGDYAGTGISITSKDLSAINSRQNKLKIAKKNGKY